MMEHVKGGTLLEYVKAKEDKLSEEEVQQIMVALVNAVAYCHS